jgi:hypothetical protein
MVVVCLSFVDIISMVLFIIIFLILSKILSFGLYFQYLLRLSILPILLLHSIHDNMVKIGK